MPSLSRSLRSYGLFLMGLKHFTRVAALLLSGLVLPHGIVGWPSSKTILAEEKGPNKGTPQVVQPTNPVPETGELGPEARAPLDQAKANSAATGQILAQARGLALRGRTAEAVELYRPLARSGSVPAAVGLARCLRERGQDVEAQSVLKNAGQEQPASAELPAELLAELADLAWSRGRWAEATRQAKKALQKDPNQLLARWVVARLARDTGKLAEAEQHFQWLIDYYNRTDKFADPHQLRWIGLAAAEYARWNALSDQFSFLVNDLSQQQLALEKGYWPAHYEAGRLYAEKFNQAEASRAFSQALALNPNAAEVHVALAEMAVRTYRWEDARRHLDRAQLINPHSADALRLRADLEVANFHVAQAIDYLKRARALNPRSEQTLGRLAACYLILDSPPGTQLSLDIENPAASDPQPASHSRFLELVSEVNRRNPACGVFHEAVARTLDTRQRFEEAAWHYQLAIKRMPQLIGPRSALGLLRLRLAEEDQGRRFLKESFERDPFNVRVSNTLQVLELLDGYDTHQTEHFVIRYQGLEDQILAHYVGEYLEQQYPLLCKQFGFQVPQKSLFEIFTAGQGNPGHAWFSTRMVGLPYVGTVGACAGKMVAVASPNERPYNWARVMKHEFVHVINLQQTHFNLPHWFAEGLAVINEGYPRPRDWNRLLLERWPAESFDLETINLGFIRPDSRSNWQLAYCQAELYVEYMFDSFGEGAAARLLSAYEKGHQTPEAIRHAFAVSLDEFERGYRRYVDEVVAQIRPTHTRTQRSLGELLRLAQRNPEDADLQADLASAYLRRREITKAQTHGQKALQGKPKQPQATYVLARLAIAGGQLKKAQTLLQGVLDEEEPDSEVLQLLAAIVTETRQYDRAAELYHLGIRRWPDDLRWKRGLARAHLLGGRHDRLAKALRQIAASDADDYTVRKKLAQLARAAGDQQQTLHWCQEALYINVLDVDIHQWLAEASLALGRQQRAIAEYTIAGQLQPAEPKWPLSVARVHLKSNRPDQARLVLAELLQRFPDHAEASDLWKTLPK